MLQIAILLRGLPGSGKTHIAQQLRKMEMEATGDAPRIHSIDDYFMTVSTLQMTKMAPVLLCFLIASIISEPAHWPSDFSLV